MRLPRSSLAPVAPAPISSIDEAVAADRPELLDRQAVLPGEQHQRRGEPGTRGQRRAATGSRRTAPRPATWPTASRTRAPRARSTSRTRRARRPARRPTRPGRWPRAAVDGLADERLERRLAREVERRRAVLHGGAGQRRVRRPGQARRRLADEQDRRRRRSRNAGPTSLPMSSSRPTTPISGVGAIGAVRRLVVERDVAAGDGQAERPARVAQAADALAAAARTPRGASDRRS